MSQSSKIILALILALILGANLFDMREDFQHNAPLWHLLEEGMVVSISIAGAFYLLLSLRRQSHETRRIRQELEDVRERLASADARMRDARKQYSQVIKTQFEDWKLTPGEQGVAMLLLKGLSLREIAALRETREKTVRQQASSLYKKARIEGRHALSAWFLEDFIN